MHRLLLCLPPEIAHRLGILGLKFWQFFLARSKSRLPVTAPGFRIASLPRLNFTSRVGLAAGFDKNAEVFAALSRFGFGFVEVGTVTLRPQPGNAGRRLWRIRDKAALVNRLGFNSCGLTQFRRNLERLRPLVPHLPVLVNIGKNRQTPNEGAQSDYAEAFRALQDRVDGFVVNLSSPNTPGLRDLQSVAFLQSILSIAPVVPLWIKLAPDLDDRALTELCAFIGSEPRYTGVVVTNTSRRLALEAGFAEGGLSGAPLLARSLECIAIARGQLKPTQLVIGVGGITSVEAARQARRAGADLFEIYTGFIYRGPQLVQKLAQVD